MRFTPVVLCAAMLHVFFATSTGYRVRQRVARVINGEKSHRAVAATEGLESKRVFDSTRQPNGIFCTWENQQCDATGIVYYGFGNTFAEMLRGIHYQRFVKDGIACTTESFGGEEDPHFGKYKACFTQTEGDANLLITVKNGKYVQIDDALPADNKTWIRRTLPDHSRKNIEYIVLKSAASQTAVQVALSIVKAFNATNNDALSVDVQLVDVQLVHESYRNGNTELTHALLRELSDDKKLEFIKAKAEYHSGKCNSKMTLLHSSVCKCDMVNTVIFLNDLSNTEQKLELLEIPCATCDVTALHQAVLSCVALIPMILDACGNEANMMKLLKISGDGDCDGESTALAQAYAIRDNETRNTAIWSIFQAVKSPNNRKQLCDVAKISDTCPPEDIPIPGA